MTTQNIENFLQENLFPGNTKAFSDLKTELEKGEVIALVGAGASAPSFPTWETLLVRLLTDAKEQGLISTSDHHAISLQMETDPLEAASSLEEAFTHRVFRGKLAELFRSDAGCTSAHRLIVTLKLKGAVTLNYDSGLERAVVAVRSCLPQCLRAQDDTEATRWLQGGSFDPENFPILHLHGLPTDPDKMVFTSDDYNKFYSTAEAQRLIQKIWCADRMLAIGFGFRDPFLTALAESTLRALPSDLRHFALIGTRESSPKSPLIRRTFAKKFRLQPIFYQIHDVGPDLSHGHSDLLGLLEALCPKPTDQVAPHASPLKVRLVHTQTKPPARVDEPVSSQHARKEFEKNLFSTAKGRHLYAEPRLAEPNGISDPIERLGTHEHALTVKEIVQSTESYLISAASENGLTTLCKRLLVDLREAGNSALFYDANDLPNYRKRLEIEFGPRAGLEGAILILDNLDIDRHERLLKELAGLKLFARYILCSHLSESRNSAFVDVDALPIQLKPLKLLTIGRADIRSLAEILYDTSDHDLLSQVVDKVYSDLTDLCIPLTPSNAIMFLTILHKDGDFNPLNRTQIVERYIYQLLRRPSDLYKDSFNAKTKIEVIAAFVYHLYMSKSSSWSLATWSDFCAAYMTRALINFDDRSLLNELLSARVVLQINGGLVFKYKFFYSFFLGTYVANRTLLLKDFMANDSYLNVSGLAEVISGTSSDNTALVADLSSKLEASVAAFNQKYLSTLPDPFLQISWPVQDSDEDKIWKPLISELASGPSLPQEIDRVKSSLLSEMRTEDQIVVIRNFDAA